MKKMMLLFGFVFMVGVASSETNEYQTALSIGFEEEEGYVLGEIVWQNGWTGRQGRHEVTADTACSGTQSLNFNGIETGDYDAEYRFECDNPDGLPMHISFKFKPSENGLLRFYPFEGQGHIINMFLGRTQFSADAPKYMFKNIEPALDSNEWYEAGLYLNPIDRVVDSFYLGDCFFEDEYGYEYMEYGETGVPDGIAFYTSWADDKTVAYVDDVKVEVMLPEPACLGLLALAGLFFLRKRSKRMHMKRCFGFTLLAVLAFSFCGCVKEKAKKPSAAYGVLERVFGDSSHFELSYAPSMNTNLFDTFSYEAKEGKVSVKGENDLAIVRGCYEYLKDVAGVMVTWQQRHPKVENYPDAELTVGGTPHKFRHHFNVCTFGYTAPYWKWDRWEEELDWLALHGVNMPLAMVGFQAVARKVWQDQGVSEAGLREYFPGPAYLPWFIMGNLYKHNGPCPDKFIDETKVLQDKILARMREFGMTPVVPGFAGFVPEEYAEAHGKTNFHPRAHWCALPGECKSWWIAPGTETFTELTKAWMQTYTNMYGPVKYFLADSFNEMEIPVTSTLMEDLRRYGRESYAAIHSAIDDAVWVMQGWMFFFQKDTWTREAVQSFLKDVPVGGIIIIDLANDNMQVWKEHDGFYGHEWLRCIAHTFGGFNDPHAELQKNYSKMFDQVGDPDKGRQVGVGLTPEALDNNEVVFELLSDSAWQEKEGKLGDWLALYCKARYGAYNPAVSNAWDHFLKSFYKGKGEHYRFQGTPHLAAWYRNSFEDEWEKGIPNLLSCSNEFAKSSLYVDDCVEFTMRYAMVAADRIIAEAAFSHLFGLTNEIVRAADRLDNLAGLMEKLAATREHLLLSRWADRAREWGTTEEEKKYYASDAKYLLSAWGGFLNGYATRAWSGIIAYHNSEWQHFLRKLASGMKDDDIQWELRDLEKAFWNAGKEKEGYREINPDWCGACRETLDLAKKEYDYSAAKVDELLLRDRGKQYAGFGYSDSAEPVTGKTFDLPSEFQDKKEATVIIKGPAHAVPMKVYFEREGKKRLVFKPLEYVKDFVHGDEHRYVLKVKKPFGAGKIVLEFDRPLVQSDHWAGVYVK